METFENAREKEEKDKCEKHEHYHRHEWRCKDKDHDKDDDDKCKDKDKDRCKDHDHDKDRRCCKKRHHDKCRDDDKHCDHDRGDSHHIRELEKSIKALSDALAMLGRGGHLQELQRVIHCPGWTTQAEFAFVNTILDHISVEVRTLDRLQADLVEASRKVTHKHR